MAAGVYAILNKVTGKVYIGSSQRLATRRSQHFSDLRRGSHHSQKLQRSFTKHGETAFVFFVLEECGSERLLSQEQVAIDAFDSCRRGYNVSGHAGAVMRGRKHTPETLQKMRLTRRGRVVSAEVRARIGRAHRGRVVSDVTRARISASKRGKPGWIPNAAVREKKRLAATGKRHTPGARAKMSASARNRAPRNRASNGSYC